MKRYLMDILGSITCATGSTCVFENSYYSQYDKIIGQMACHTDHLLGASRPQMHLHQWQRFQPLRLPTQPSPLAETVLMPNSSPTERNSGDLVPIKTPSPFPKLPPYYRVSTEVSHIS